MVVHYKMRYTGCVVPQVVQREDEFYDHIAVLNNILSNDSDQCAKSISDGVIHTLDGREERVEIFDAVALATHAVDQGASAESLCRFISLNQDVVAVLPPECVQNVLNGGGSSIQDHLISRLVSGVWSK